MVAVTITSTVTETAESVTEADHTARLTLATGHNDPTHTAQSDTDTTTKTTSKSPTPRVVPHYKPEEIECWGHRGASAHLPENTYVLVSCL